jgi:fumarate hydratase class I
MREIRRQDLVDSIADALQYISCYHPPDFIRAMSAAYRREENAAARNAIGQVLANARMAALAHRPVCQDTGIVVAFAKVGVGARLLAEDGLQSIVDEAVARAYRDPHNPLRASIVTDPAGKRSNTGDNTPAVVHTELVAGDEVHITVAAKGGGSENKARFAVLNPSDDLVEWVVDQVRAMGAGWCPPGILGVGIGGSPEKALLLAKESLMAPLDIGELQARGPSSRAEELRLQLYERINRLGIGAQGLGGLTTALDVKVLDYPTHAASLPVAVIPNCAATRHIHFSLDGSGPARFEPPDLSDWPQGLLANGDEAAHVDLGSVTREDVRAWSAGDMLLLSGKLLTGRDAAHKRIREMVEHGEPLPVAFRDRFLYYVGPVEAVGDEIVGPAGPTTSTRMDKFTDLMLGERVGVLGMIGKAERGPSAIESIKRHGAVYLIATGGAAYLVSKAIRSARTLAFDDLGMEAIREFEVRDMPVTVAVDSRGQSIHTIGPTAWRLRIEHASSA